MTSSWSRSTRPGRDLDRAHSRWLALLAETERRDATTHQVSMPTASWLAAGTRHSAKTARAHVRLAVLLGQHPAVAAALAAGEMSLEQATVLVHGLDQLPSTLDPPRNAPRSPPATKAAPSPTATDHPPTATPTTPSPGTKAETPT